MTTREIVEAILLTYSGPFYVAATATQKERIIREAVANLEREHVSQYLTDARAELQAALKAGK